MTFRCTDPPDLNFYVIRAFEGVDVVLLARFKRSLLYRCYQSRSEGGENLFCDDRKGIDSISTLDASSI